MQQKSTVALRSVLFLLTSFLIQSGRAADGFDNNYFGGDANTLLVSLNGDPKAFLFGPGNLSIGGFNLHVPNGSYRDLGILSSFTMSQAISHVRSAYLDRVISTTFYYRVYADGESSPNWSSMSLQAAIPLDPDSCFTTSQDNSWSLATSINFLAGLSPGYYVMEFYIQSELYDVGIEAPDPCAINASMQCTTSEVHSGRYLSSRFNTTDPSACNLISQLAGQSGPSKVVFQVGTVGVAGLQMAAYNLSAWPNPVVEELHFQLPEGRNEYLYASISSASGQWISSQMLAPEMTASVPVGDLPKGLYFLVVYDEKARCLGQTRFFKN